MIYRTLTRCRGCTHAVLESVLDLGNHAISTFLDTPDQAVARAPLHLVRCPSCNLVQLSASVVRDHLYRRYWYRSGVNETMRAALQDVARDALAHVELEKGDHILDIASNDGTLLRCFPNWVRRIGIDPSDVAYESVASDITVIHDYFPPEKLDLTVVPCKIITAIAMVYDLDDPVGFLREVARWLHPDGVFVLQYQGLEDMLSCNGLDNVVAEHVTYPSFAVVSDWLERAGLRIESWSMQTINGSSTRLIVRHAARVPHPPKSSHVTPQRMETFAARARINKFNICNFLAFHKKLGHGIYGLAASTKWNTWAQYANLGPDQIVAIADRSPEKVGKYTVTGIPIISEEQMRAARPDVLLCCAWQFAEAFADREHALLDAGTLMVAHLPHLRVVSLDGGTIGTTTAVGVKPSLSTVGLHSDNA